MEPPTEPSRVPGAAEAMDAESAAGAADAMDDAVSAARPAAPAARPAAAPAAAAETAAQHDAIIRAWLPHELQTLFDLLRKMRPQSPEAGLLVSKNEAAIRNHGKGIVSDFLKEKDEEKRDELERTYLTTMSVLYALAYARMVPEHRTLFVRRNAQQAMSNRPTFLETLLFRYGRKDASHVPHYWNKIQKLATDAKNARALFLADPTAVPTVEPGAIDAAIQRQQQLLVPTSDGETLFRLDLDQ